MRKQTNHKSLITNHAASHRSLFTFHQSRLPPRMVANDSGRPSVLNGEPGAGFSLLIDGTWSIGPKVQLRLPCSLHKVARHPNRLGRFGAGS
jgi:hypothetical protein